MIRLSLTTTPVTATSPNIDMIDTFKPRKTCPQTAPTSPNGMALMMISGCTYDRSGTASNAKIISSASVKPRCSPPRASRCSAIAPSNV